MEKIEVLNRRLVDHYGKYLDGQPNYRIVFSDLQFEKVLTNFTENGIELLFPEVKELPKYTYIKGKWLLEKLLEVPEINEKEMTTKLTYECIWCFEDLKGNPLPAKWEAAKFVIEVLHQNMSKVSGEVYRDSYAEAMADPKIAVEAKEKELQNLMETLYGNETNTTDRLALKEGIVVPSNYRNQGE